MMETVGSIMVADLRAQISSFAISKDFPYVAALFFGAEYFTLSVYISQTMQQVATCDMGERDDLDNPDYA